MELTKQEQRDVARGLAQVLRCANCNVEVLYGSMNLIALAISGHKPCCSYECNKALGQVDPDL